jgi:hypothetical protein
MLRYLFAVILVHVQALAVEVVAKPFPLSAVCLEDRLFAEAQARDCDWLLRFEPGRLLAGFRSAASLQKKTFKLQ